MHTSVIRYRVADFLGDHPPFDAFSLEELLAFSGTGRVSFHEDDVFLYRKGDARRPVVWVIQQGRVELVDETPTGLRLWDVLGPGDVLGADRKAEYTQSARTATEAILYAFELDAFESLVARSPAASRYVAAHLSATARHTKALRPPGDRDRVLTEREQAGWLRTSGTPASLALRRPVTCAPDVPTREVARLLGTSHADSVVVTGPDGAPLGLISSTDVCAVYAATDAGRGTTAGTLMRRSFRTALPALRTPDYVLEMLRGRTRTVVVTDDGSASSPLRELVTDADLTIDGGRNPALIMSDILGAHTFGDLAHLRARAEAFVAEGLAGPSTVDWFAEMTTELDDALVERLVALAEADLAIAGWVRPRVASCWLAFGRAGRRESLAAEAPELGVVYDDPPHDERDRVAAYFTTLGGLVLARLPHCGLAESRRAADPRLGPAAATRSAWVERYTAWIHDPIGTAIAVARDRFDARVVCGDAALGASIAEAVGEKLARAEAFLPVLANDTLAALPPLTFYRGQAIDEDGSVRSALDCASSALEPLVDAARVLGLAAGRTSTTRTLDRLAAAAVAMPQFRSIFDDAAEGMRILAYHDAVARRMRSEDVGRGASGRLSRFEQRMLKSAFDMARRFVDLAATVSAPGAVR